MTALHFTLVADGSSDRVLLRHLDWLVREHLPQAVPVYPQWADLRALRERPRGLAERIAAALDLYPCDLLFIHRDAEREDPAVRYAEIAESVDSLGIETPPFVCVVPVRMTEAWLLFDEEAVRLAAGNPHGRESIPIPANTPDHIPDPKATLHDALRQASGLSGRRRQDRKIQEAVHRVADYIDDFSPLRRLAAFARLEKELETVIEGIVGR